MMSPARPLPKIQTDVVPTVSDIITSGSYVDHINPTTRSHDSFTGKIIGWLEEYLFWLDIEGKCSFIDSVIPELPVIGSIDNLFISIFRQHYNKRYQTVYNSGADRGNEIHNLVFGQFDAIVDDYNQRIKDAYDTLTNIINDAKDRIATLKSNIDAFDVKIRDFTSKIGTFDLKMNDFSSNISDFQNRIEGFRINIAENFQKLSDLDSLTSILKRKVGKVETLVNSFDTRIKNSFAKMNSLEIQIDAFESRFAEANRLLNEHASNINDLLERVKNLETGKTPFRIPTLEEIRLKLP